MKNKKHLSSNKKVILIGINSPIKLKSKKYVIEKLYERAKKNPFLANSSYDEYLEFLQKQIKELGNTDVYINEDDAESNLYDALKRIKWLKVINAFVIGIIEATNIGA